MASASPILTPDPKSAAWSIYVTQQTFEITGLAGAPVTLSINDIDEQIHFVSAQATVYGFSLGFTAMLFLVMIPMTQRRQQRTPTFILNLITLFLFGIRQLFASVGVNLPFFGFAGIYLGATAQYPMSAFWPRYSGVFLTSLYFITLTASLVLQFRVVFAATPKTQEIVTWVAVIVAIVFNCFNVAWEMIQFYLTWHTEKYPEYLWMDDIVTFYFLSFVVVGSALFLYKLGVTIHRRRRMGMDMYSFGPLQIIFVFSAQCLIVPGISHRHQL
jgi:pheromone alpha factor receptor